MPRSRNSRTFTRRRPNIQKRNQIRRSLQVKKTLEQLRQSGGWKNEPRKERTVLFDPKPHNLPGSYYAEDDSSFLMFSEIMGPALDIVLNETNAQGARRYKRWKPISQAEFAVFVSILIDMGMCRRNNMK